MHILEVHRLSRKFIFVLVLTLSLANISFADDIKPIAVTQTDKCRVCGMFVAKYTNWIAQIIFEDGSYAVFDGPKDMFKYYLDPTKYEYKTPPKKVRSLFVTDYYSVKLIDARSAFYVTDSDVYGPMGKELVPFISGAHAQEFLKDHHGTSILNFKDVKSEMLE